MPTKKDLFTAAAAGDLETIQACIEAGLPIDARDKEGYTPLMRAAEAGKLEAMRALLAAGADRYAAAPNGYSPLLCAVHSVDALRLLKEVGVDLERPNSTSAITPLMFAAQLGHVDSLRYLLEIGANPDTKDKWGRTAFDRANPEGRKWLKSYFKNKTEQGAPEAIQKQKTAQKKRQEDRRLCKAAAKGDVAEIRERLSQGASVEVTDRDGYTPLMRAAEHARLDAVRALLDAGADVNGTTDNTAIDALYLACAAGATEVVRELLARGASLTLRSETQESTGYTHLMAAVLSCDLDLVKLLVEAGSDINAQDFSGATALTWAREQRQKAIASYLKSKGGLTGQELRPAAKKPRKPVVADDPTNPMKVLRAAVKNFPFAAETPAFQDALKFLAEAAGTAPKESRRRPGVYLLGLSPKRFDALADHYQLPRPEFDEDPVEEAMEAASAITDKLQEDVRARGFLLMVDCLFDVCEPRKTWLYPSADPYAVIAACGTNGNNYGLSTRKIIAWLRDMEQSQPFVLTSCGHDYVGGWFLGPVVDPKKLAQDMYQFCPDIVDQGTETVKALAKALEQEQEFYFWWD